MLFRPAEFGRLDFDANEDVAGQPTIDGIDFNHTSHMTNANGKDRPRLRSPLHPPLQIDADSRFTHRPTFNHLP